MSKKQIQVTQAKEEEDVDLFVETLKKIMATSPASRGPAAKAIMSSFQIYYEMIGSAPTEKQTR